MCVRKGCGLQARLTYSSQCVWQQGRKVMFLTSDVWYWQKCLFFEDSSMIVSMGMCVLAWVCVCVSLCVCVLLCVIKRVYIFLYVCVKEIKAKEEGDRRWNLIDNVLPRWHLLLLDKITTSLRLHQEQAHYRTSWYSEKIFLIGQEEIVPPLKNFGTSICLSRLQHQWIRSAGSSVASSVAVQYFCYLVRQLTSSVASTWLIVFRAVQCCELVVTQVWRGVMWTSTLQLTTYIYFIY